MNNVNSETPATYHVKRTVSAAEQDTIDSALAILDKAIRHADVIDSPELSSSYVRLQLAQELAEVFCVLFLDTRHRVISFDRMFNGTIDGASVHPREVVRRALHHNAAAVVLTHNHPSGTATPSEADKRITTRLKDALSLVDVRVLDHIIVGDSTFSFAEQGLI